jgi:DNA-binding Lrp family transcriptional regulator
MKRPDAKDLQILSALQANGRMSNAALAKTVHLAEAPTWRRVRELEESGVIAGYRAAIDRTRLGYNVTAFVQMRFASHDPELQARFEAEIVRIPEVLWCHNVSGATDWLLCVVARDLTHYGQFVSSTIRALPGVTAIESSFSLKCVKDDDFRPDPATTRLDAD